MARKKKHEEHENHERWLVSYADFITLLFAFFVVMYSISSVNEGKYRVLSSTLVTAFSHPAKTVDPIQYGTPLRAPIIQHQLLKDQSKDTDVSRVGVDYQLMPTPGQMAKMEKIADQVKHDMKKLIEKGLVEVSKTNKGVEIAINSEILFASGEARLSDSAQQILKQVAALLKSQNNHINVEGYTDNVPITTEAFPSNWELSAARAASVVHLFTSVGVQPQRLAAIGFGEYRPVAPNISDEGRRKNRRVGIMVLNEPYQDTIKLDDIDKIGNPAKAFSDSFKGKAGKDKQDAELIVLPMAGKRPVKQGAAGKPIVLGAPTNSTSAQNIPATKAGTTADTAPKGVVPLSLPLNTSGGRPSVIQLPPTNVITAP